MSSVFTTPLLSPCLRALARGWLRLSGWRVEAALPPQAPCVLIGAPHTSNWDFPLLLVAILDLGLDLKWMGKHTLFRTPWGPLMRWLGGIAVNRTQNNNLVASTVQAFADNPGLIVCIPPEGTRSKVQRWRSGFYHIAVGAGVPILLSVIDAEHKTLRVLGEYRPSGINPEHEIHAIQQFYRGYRGLRPERAFEIPAKEASPE
jgi:1-acyl-sn-glycerol-3-phosphate acyltransferase